MITNVHDYDKEKAAFDKQIAYMKNRLDDSVKEWIAKNPNASYDDLPTWMKAQDRAISILEDYKHTAEALIKKLERENHEEFSRGVEAGKRIERRIPTIRESRFINKEAARKIYNEYKDKLYGIR